MLNIDKLTVKELIIENEMLHSEILFGVFRKERKVNK